MKSRFFESYRARTATSIIVGLLLGLGLGSWQEARAGDGNFPKLEALRKEAAQGDARAQFKLGDYHYARAEFKEAAKWYELSAGQGHAVAQSALANCYATGRGVAQNSAKAAQWSRLASHQKALPPAAVPTTQTEPPPKAASPSPTLTPTPAANPESDSPNSAEASAWAKSTPSLPPGANNENKEEALMVSAPGFPTIVHRRWVIVPPPSAIPEAGLVLEENPPTK